MFRIDNATAAGVLPTVPPAGTPGYFTNGNPTAAIPATVVDAWWANMLQEEILTVVTRAGLTANKTDNTQLWQALQALIGTRTTVSQNVTAYVEITGSDTTGDGSSGNPFATITKAVTYFASSLNLNGHTATVSIGAGTYASGGYGGGGGAMVGGPILGQTGAGSLVFATHGTGPAIINGIGLCLAGQNGAAFTINGNFVFNTAALALSVNSHVFSGAGAQIIIVGPNLNFGAAPTTGNHIMAASNGNVTSPSAGTSYEISGGAGAHWSAQVSGSLVIEPISPLTVVNTPNFTIGFAVAQNLGVIACAGNVFSGAATGVRYSASGNGVINTNGGGANYLPGNAVGTVASGGQYI